MKKKILLIAGARPNFMKVAPLLKELDRKRVFDTLLVHTGQHYDYGLSDVFFKDFEIPKPDYFLNASRGTPSEQVARIIINLEKVCLKVKPELIVVVGDVNSTLAASIAAKKMQIALAHVEAGLRSFDLGMPEEINRMVADTLSDLLFVSEPSGVRNLLKEGKPKEKIFLVGNTMIDSLVFGLNKLNDLDAEKFSLSPLKEQCAKYGVVTLHRPSNVDCPKNLKGIFNILNKISRKIPLFFPVHPRTRNGINANKIKVGERIHLLEPLGYLEFLFLYKDARVVLTDSGGLQEETTFLKIPCLTLRDNTERPVTVEQGTNTLVGADFKLINRLVNTILAGKYKKGSSPRLWDGRAASRIADVLIKKLG